MDIGEELDYEPVDEDVTTFRPWRTTATRVNLHESKSDLSDSHSEYNGGSTSGDED